MLASRVLITAGTPDSMYLEDRQENWLRRRRNVGKRAGGERERKIGDINAVSGLKKGRSGYGEAGRKVGKQLG